MILLSLTLALIGMVCGLILLPVLGVALLSLAVTVAFSVVTQMNWMLVPNWLALLTALQGGYIAGLAIRWLWGKETNWDQGRGRDSQVDDLKGNYDRKLVVGLLLIALMMMSVTASIISWFRI